MKLVLTIAVLCFEVLLLFSMFCDALSDNGMAFIDLICLIAVPVVASKFSKNMEE